MARIAGVDLPRNKKIEFALPYIYGIGHTSSQKILDMAGIDPNTRVNELTEENVLSIRNAISDITTVEGELRGVVTRNMKRLMDIGCYRGIRHRNGLPLRGQRTKNNSRTRKGRRKTVANKKE